MGAGYRAGRSCTRAVRSCFPDRSNSSGSRRRPAATCRPSLETTPSCRWTTIHTSGGNRSSPSSVAARRTCSPAPRPWRDSSRTPTGIWSRGNRFDRGGLGKARRAQKCQYGRLRKISRAWSILPNRQNRRYCSNKVVQDVLVNHGESTMSSVSSVNASESNLYLQYLLQEAGQSAGSSASSTDSALTTLASGSQSSGAGRARTASIASFRRPLRRPSRASRIPAALRPTWKRPSRPRSTRR